MFCGYVELFLYAILIQRLGHRVKMSYFV